YIICINLLTGLITVMPRNTLDLSLMNRFCIQGMSHENDGKNTRIYMLSSVQKTENWKTLLRKIKNYGHKLQKRVRKIPNNTITKWMKFRNTKHANCISMSS